MNRKLITLFLLICQTGFAQEVFKKTQIQTTFGSLISSDSTTPFLLRSNQYGLVPFKSGIGYFNVSIKKEYDSLYLTTGKKLKKFGFGYGLETHLNLGRTNQILLPVAHVKVRYGVFELYGGRRREIQGLVDTLGTMGSYIWSGNALPMPKIEISIPNYTPIMKNGLIAIKGNFAHGWFGKGDSVQNVWLHQKSLYARIGKPTWKVHFIGGFNHQVQWGGYPTKPFYDEISQQTIEKFGTNFPTFIKVISGISMNKNGIGWDNQPGVASNEAGNRSGNHLGSIEIGLELDVISSRIFIYRQSFYDDGSLYYLNNISDGLYGISIKRSSGIFRNICFEYFNTKNQGGSIYSDNPAELRGIDNYFNNSVYKDNWVYRENSIGSPLMFTSKHLPFYSTFVNKKTIINNRLSAFHLSTFYSFKMFSGSTQFLQSNNFGSYAFPYEMNQMSISQKINFRHRKQLVSATISGDVGILWKNSIGLNMQVKRSF